MISMVDWVEFPRPPGFNIYMYFLYYMGTNKFWSFFIYFRLNRLDSKSQPPTFVIGHLLRISSQYIVGSYDSLKEVLKY